MKQEHILRCLVVVEDKSRLRSVINPHRPGPLALTSTNDDYIVLLLSPHIGWVDDKIFVGTGENFTKEKTHEVHTILLDQFTTFLLSRA